jgi:hypothetical protein
MYRKEYGETSPMRVFERSLHGGLGRGNVGAIVAPAGVGKTALLVQIALDDLMRDRRVLHISHEHPVDRVRAFYDEIFYDMALVTQLAEPHAVRLEIERNRLIYSHLGAVEGGPPSHRGGTSSIARIEQTAAFASVFAQFRPDTVLIDGFDFAGAVHEAFVPLRTLAGRLGAELWLSAKSHDGEGAAARVLERFGESLDVVVVLEHSPTARSRGSVRLRLLKEHDNPNASELHLLLDPVTMRVVDGDLPPAPRPPKDPKTFHLFSGGARGAEAFFGSCAERWGAAETHYTFDGHRMFARERGSVVLAADELKKGDTSLVYASHRLARPLSEIPEIRHILQTVWHVVTAANEVFVIGVIQDNGTVRGGTGWGAELGRLWSKRVCVFDQEKGDWFRWDPAGWQPEPAPVITRRAFAGIGTMRLTPAGEKAIHDLFERTFGPPPS